MTTQNLESLRVRTQSELWREYKARNLRNRNGARIFVALVTLGIGVIAFWAARK